MPIFFGIEKLYLFPVYHTREDYKNLTGLDAPTFDPNLPVKSWSHPNPDDGTGTSGTASAASLKITYSRVIAYGEDGRSPLLDGGRPYFEELQLLKTWAKRVNIPPKDFSSGSSHQPDVSTLGEVPCPCRPLKPTESLVQQFGGAPRVFDTAVDDPNDPNQVPTSPTGGLSTREKAILELIPSIFEELTGGKASLPPK